MRLPAWLLPGLVFTLPAFAPQAGEPDKAEQGHGRANDKDKARPERVHLGATSVIVVDEHEAVDDVISRIRSAKSDTAAAAKSKDGAKSEGTQDRGTRSVTATDGRQESGRAALRAQRSQATARENANRLEAERRERTESARTRLEQKRRR